MATPEERDDRSHYLRLHRERIIAEVDELDGHWYAVMPLPDKLAHDMGELPIVEEVDIPEIVINKDEDNLMNLSAIERRRQNAQLSPAQILDLRYASHGLQDQEIADARQVSIETIKSQLKKTFPLLGAKNRTHAVALALRLNLFK